MKYKYFWGRFKNEIHTQKLIIIEVEQANTSKLNCSIMACDDMFGEEEFEFIEEIKYPGK